MSFQATLLAVTGLYLGLGASAGADVFNMGSGLTSLDFVTVGNPGNKPADYLAIRSCVYIAKGDGNSLSSI